MARFLFICGILISVLPVSGQVVKTIFLNSVPVGAQVTCISGKVDLLGNTPVSYKFDFHSDISVLKTKISACGFYDTIIKVTPQTDSLKIVMVRKKLLILPDSQSDTLQTAERKIFSLLLTSFLETFSQKNISQPVNFMDFAVFRKSEQKRIITLIFEAEPEYLILPGTVTSDSILIEKWKELFSGTLDVFNKKQFAGIKNTEYYFSVISGKKNLSVRHLPGVEQNDEFRVKTSVYEDDYKSVTTVTSYYETVINPTFNSTLNQSQKYTELLFKLIWDNSLKSYRLGGTAAIRITNNKVNLLYESYTGLSNNSMLEKFMR